MTAASLFPGTPAGFALPIVAGGLVVWVGAELLVRGASRVAASTGMSSFLVGATVVAFGTSAPELVVSLVAHWHGDSALSLGNVVGSNVCNIALVLGLTALLLPVRVRRGTLRLELPFVLAAELLFCVLALDGRIGLGDGIVFLAAFASIYAAFVLRSRPPAEQGTVFASPLWRNVLMTVVGLAALAAGARVFVAGAAGLAGELGMPAVTIGATIVAIGTSLPELVTSVVAALRGHLDISVGNLLGSNLFNALLVGGCLTTIGPVPVAHADFYHVWWMLGTTVLIFPLATYTRLLGSHREPRVDRLGALVLLAGYAIYLLGAFR